MRNILGTGNGKMMKVMSLLGDSLIAKQDYLGALHMFQECWIVLNNLSGF